MKDIQSHPLEKETFDNTVGVDTTFHHGFNVIVIHVGSSSANDTHKKHRHEANINRNFFMKI
jgi:hypothetical protein